jgi:hypothetical protein
LLRQKYSRGGNCPIAFLTSYNVVLLALRKQKEAQGNVGRIGEMQRRASSLKHVLRKQLTSIPNLSLHRLSINIDGSCSKFYADGRLRLEIEFIPCEPREYWEAAKDVKALIQKTEQFGGTYGYYKAKYSQKNVR